MVCTCSCLLVPGFHLNHESIVQSIAVTSNPALLTVHSIQNGRVLVSTPVHFDRNRGDVCGVWWFREEKQIIGNGLPDIFKRGDNIVGALPAFMTCYLTIISQTGAAHSILRNLPLLEPLQDEMKPLGLVPLVLEAYSVAHIEVRSNELFAFQGARNRPVQKAPLPHCIYFWPTLPPDHAAASIAVNKPNGAESHLQETEIDEQDDTNTNSILAVADTLGYIHLYLEGTYRMGPVNMPPGKHFPRSVYKHREYLFSHIGPITPDSDGAVGLFPHIIKLPYLPGRHLRDVARASTIARELLSYALRVVKDMRALWFGSETQVGARELGPKWVNALNSRQATAFGRKSLWLCLGLLDAHARPEEEPHAVLDLTCLLTTGRSSDGLMDFLGSGEHMSDRVCPNIILLSPAALTDGHRASKNGRPSCVKRCSGCGTFQRSVSLQPANGCIWCCRTCRGGPRCELQPWLLSENFADTAYRPQYARCKIKSADVEACLELTATAIFQASWLANAARKELLRFKEFMKWIRYGTWLPHLRTSVRPDVARRGRPSEYQRRPQWPAPSTRHPRGERVPDL